MNIDEKILNVQAEMPEIDKNAKNPHFKSSYTDLPHLLSVSLPILQKYKILYNSSCEIDHVNVRLTDVETGERRESHIPFVSVTDMQKLGGAITYASRYGLLQLLGLVPEIDDDGNSVSGIEIKPEIKKPKPPVKKVEKEQPKGVDVNYIKKLMTDKADLLSEQYTETFKKRLAEGDNDKLLKIQNYLEDLGK